MNLCQVLLKMKFPSNLRSININEGGEYDIDMIKTKNVLYDNNINDDISRVCPEMDELKDVSNLTKICLIVQFLIQNY